MWSLGIFHDAKFLRCSKHLNGAMRACLGSELPVLRQCLLVLRDCTIYSDRLRQQPRRPMMTTSIAGIRIYALLLFCLLPWLSACERHQPPIQNDADVIVVGAGLAGLSAAVEMGRSGVWKDKDGTVVMELDAKSMRKKSPDH